MAHASLQTRRRSAAARLHEPRRIAQTLTHCPTTCEEALLATQASHRVTARTVTKRDVIGSPPFSPFPSHALRELADTRCVLLSLASSDGAVVRHRSVVRSAPSSNPLPSPADPQDSARLSQRYRGATCRTAD